MHGIESGPPWLARTSRRCPTSGVSPRPPRTLSSFGCIRSASLSSGVVRPAVRDSVGFRDGLGSPVGVDLPAGEADVEILACDALLTMLASMPDHRSFNFGTSGH